MARSHLSQAPGRRPQRLTRCALALSIAEHGEDGVPPDKRRVSGRSWKSAAIRSAVLRVSATCALAGDHPSSAARRAQESTSATRSAARPPLRSLSAASSGRLRARGPRSTVDFIRAQARYSAAGREGVVATPTSDRIRTSLRIPSPPKVGSLSNSLIVINYRVGRFGSPGGSGDELDSLNRPELDSLK